MIVATLAAATLLANAS